MRRTEEALTAALDEMRRTRVKFRETAKTSAAQPAAAQSPASGRQEISEFDV
jgi:hypothetical protein